jgi:hypothetical protein
VYSSTDIIRRIKSRMMRGAGHVEGMGEMKHVHRILAESLKARLHSEDLVVEGRITLKWILRKQGGGVWTDSTGSG